ncbi:MAG: transposase [Cycloclasticus sp. symbiont of Bathymodiolus heckerae]|nr:MAG: transposase [Cycloclasticus sp. symbiont of Bathymodiolus heckerae]
MRGKRYPEEFKIEATKQVIDRGYKVSDVANRLGVTTKSLYAWVKRYGEPSHERKELTQQQAELRQLKAQLKRVTEERDILKEAAVYFASESKRNTRS